MLCAANYDSADTNLPESVPGARTVRVRTAYIERSTEREQAPCGYEPGSRAS